MASSFAALPPHPEPKMSYLDNGEVRIGMDLALGGAVTFISSKQHPGNIINSADLGRQIQMSHYSGPVPFEAGDKKPHKDWVGIGWNPIQTGDCYMNPSKVLKCRNDGKELYVKCIPMQWPLDNVPGECIYETWTTLDGPVINMRYRFTNHRSDKTLYSARAQELPAVYTISKLWRLMSYTGEKPFTGDKLTHVTNDWRRSWPWTRFTATERWAALVDESDWGLGVFKDDGGEFHGGIHGDGRSDDPKHGSTAYVAPVHVESIDHNIVYEHSTVFMVGKLEAIRARFNSMASKAPPAWRFNNDRQHWSVHNATEEGFPLKGEWKIKCGEKIPRLETGIRTWRADAAPTLKIEISCTSHISALRVFWKRLDADAYTSEKSLTLEVKPGGQYHTYTLNLSSSAEYQRLITGLALEPVLPTGDSGPAEFALKSVALAP